MRRLPLNQLRLEESIAQLKRHHLFSTLNDDQIGKLTETLQIIELANGDVLFTTADPVYEIYIVQSGQIKLSRVSSSGNEKILELSSPGESFAEAALFSEDSTFPVNATAITQSRIWCINGQQYKKILQDSPSACMLVMREMSRRLHQLVNEIDSLTLESSTARLVAFLLDQVPKDSVNTFEFNLEFSKVVLASRLSIKPETLSRILARLRQEDLVHTNERVIRIPDIERIRNWLLGDE